MDTEPTTLSEFRSESDDDVDTDDVDRAERDDAPTPTSNAEDIQQLIGLVERLNDHVGTLADELDQHDPTGRTDREPTDDRPMFH